MLFQEAGLAEFAVVGLFCFVIFALTIFIIDSIKGKK